MGAIITVPTLCEVVLLLAHHWAQAAVSVPSHQPTDLEAWTILIITVCISVSVSVSPSFLPSFLPSVRPSVLPSILSFPFFSFPFLSFSFFLLVLSLDVLS